MKLLVVDDEHPIVECMHALLTGWGHQVVSLCLDSELTPADVLEQVKLQKFDVALVDNFKMPPLLGTDLPAQIKRLSPATKIIIMDIVPLEPAVADALRREGVAFKQLLLPFERIELIFAGVFCVPRN
jgi:DNA-binding NtrC family response regulator